MADIRVERKEGSNIWGWIIGLIVAALVIWALWAWLADDEVAEAPGVVTPATTPEVVGAAPGIAINDILGDPATWLGREFTGEVRVTEVPTDRGFWITDQGARLFAIVIDQPNEQPVDINPGQTLRIDQGVLRDRTFLPQIPGAPLDAQTQQIAESVPIFLTVDERNINILTQGNPQPGTDPAQTAPTP